MAHAHTIVRVFHSPPSERKIAEMIHPLQSPIGAGSAATFHRNWKRLSADHRCIVNGEWISERWPHQRGDQPSLFGDEHVAMRLPPSELRLDVRDATSAVTRSRSTPEAVCACR